jgi:hypothetical protein
MTVRAPVWDGWGSTVSLTGDTANAIIAIIVGLFMDAVGVLAALALIKTTQHLCVPRIPSAALTSRVAIPDV